jgi:uncharacterized protein YrzB (UPF0473 family)
MFEEEEEKNGCSESGCAGCSGCGHDHDEDSEFEPVITLTDENGVDVKFEILDVVVLEDEKQYLVVSELGNEDADEQEVVILEIKDEDGEEVYDTVTDKEIAEKVFEAFQAQQDELSDESEEDEKEDK